MTITEPVTQRIGIIIPPPDVRNIVDRTAEFVARNGPEFESRVKINEATNQKFNFLLSTDPYNAYYNHRVKQCIEGTVDLISSKVSVPTAMKLAQDTPKAIQEVFEPKETPPEFEFIVDPPSINGLELDIVKLTAQFVARNGRQFLTQLMNREQRNYLFDFLRPQHNMFSYFTKLVEQFTRILLPPNDIIEKLDKESKSPEIFMKNCKYRVSWDIYQARQRKKEIEAEDKERQAYGQIDWHDFVVVEMVDYQPNEVGNFPPSTVPEEVGARSIAEERGELSNRYREDKIQQNLEEEEEEELSEEDDEDVVPPAVNSDNEDIEMADMEMSDEEDAVPAPPPLLATPQTSFKQPGGVTDASKTNLIKPGDVLIKQYDPKNKIKQQSDQIRFISPLGDNKKITTSQANKHIHVGLLDPRWKEHRDKNIRNRAQDDSPYAPGILVEQNLKTMAERRTDIFGTEETVIGRKVGEEDAKRGEKYIYDGQATIPEPYIARASDVTSRQDEKKDADFDRIGPQAIPQVAPASTITIIVNTPIISQAVSQIVLPPPPPPAAPPAPAPPMAVDDDKDEPEAKKMKQN